MQKLMALVDCNNFYASCERIFQPKLEGKPIVILSNNDGWVFPWERPTMNGSMNCNGIG